MLPAHFHDVADNISRTGKQFHNLFQVMKYRYIESMLRKRDYNCAYGS